MPIHDRPLACRWYDWILGRHYVRTARKVHALFIDVNELTDRTESTLKIIFLGVTN